MKIRDTTRDLSTLIGLGLAAAGCASTPAPVTDFQKPGHCYEIDNESDLFCKVLDLTTNPSLVNTSNREDIYVKVSMSHRDIQKIIKSPESIISDNPQRTEQLYDSWGKIDFKPGESGYLEFNRETGVLTGIYDKFHKERTNEFDIKTYVDSI